MEKVGCLNGPNVCPASTAIFGIFEQRPAEVVEKQLINDMDHREFLGPWFFLFILGGYFNFGTFPVAYFPLSTQNVE